MILKAIESKEDLIDRLIYHETIYCIMEPTFYDPKDTYYYEAPESEEAAPSERVKENATGGNDLSAPKKGNYKKPSHVRDVGKWSEDEKAEIMREIVALRDNKEMSFRGIAAALDLKENTARKWYRDFKEGGEKKRETDDIESISSQTDRDAVKSLFTVKGMTPGQIGKQIGYHADTIEKCLKEEGLL